jgi:hypothetical protein
MAMTQPGDVHSALIASAVIPDSYVRLSLSAQKPAFHVLAEAGQGEHFSDNAFDIPPGEIVNLTFTPDDPSASVDAAAFVVRDLHSSYASRST